MKRPLGVSLISYFYIFGSIVLIITSIFYDANADEVSMVARFGLSNIPEQIFRVVLALMSLLIVSGYMRLKKWGFWMMIVYSSLFAIISLSLSISHNQQPFIGNMIFSIIVLVYTFYVRRTFFTTESTK